MYCQYLQIENVQNGSIFFSRFIFEKMSVHDRWLIKKNLLTEVNLSLTATIKRENRGPLWDKPLPDHQMCFCPNFLWFCWLSLVAFGKFIFQKLVTNQLFGQDFCEVQVDTFCPHQVYEKVNLYKKIASLYHGSVRPRRENHNFFYNWLKYATFQPKLDKIFLLTISDNLRCYAKRDCKYPACSSCKPRI